MQIMLHAAGAEYDEIKDIKIRVSEIHVMDKEELQRRIISANTGSRSFSRAEIRERMGSSGGVQLNRQILKPRLLERPTKRRSRLLLERGSRMLRFKAA